MNLSIDDDVPLPQEGPHTGNITATLRALKPGQSVFIPGKKAVEMSGFVTNAGLRGMVTMRTSEDGVRVWRKDGAQ